MIELDDIQDPQLRAIVQLLREAVELAPESAISSKTRVLLALSRLSQFLLDYQRGFTVALVTEDHTYVEHSGLGTPEDAAREVAMRLYQRDTPRSAVLDVMAFPGKLMDKLPNPRDLAFLDEMESIVRGEVARG